MRISQDNNKTGGSIGRGIAVLTLAATLASAACTTNQNRGTGEPGTTGPSVGPVAPAATPGSSGTSVPNTMVSSSTEAVAIMKEHEAYRGRYLGPADPGNGAALGASVANPTGQLAPAIANPQRTVNSSISSRPTAAIVGGGDVAAGGAVTGSSSVTASSSVAGTGATAPVDPTARRALHPA